MNLGSFLVYGDDSGSLWDHMWGTLRLVLVSDGGFGTLRKPFDSFWNTLELRWNHFALILGVPWGHVGIILESFWALRDGFSIALIM